jgi:Pyruvate kinase, barrel domain
MEHVGVMAKICTPDAAARCKDIIEAADGIVLGRGTLGLELPPEKVFVAQKLCLSAANLAGKVSFCLCCRVCHCEILHPLLTFRVGVISACKESTCKKLQLVACISCKRDSASSLKF